jgi:hypothetical protein
MSGVGGLPPSRQKEVARMGHGDQMTCLKRGADLKPEPLNEFNQTGAGRKPNPPEHEPRE